MMNNTGTTRYTLTLPESMMNELKKLASSKSIPSVNFAIRQAVDDYLDKTKKLQYEKMMKEAAKDKSYIERTAKCEDDFKFADSEVQSEW